MAALVANWQLSFLRREHEWIAGSLPASHVRWQWSRDVRLLVLAISCVLLHPLWGLIATAVLGNLDALRRLLALIRVPGDARAQSKTLSASAPSSPSQRMTDSPTP
jgi:hypothetical protein